MFKDIISKIKYDKTIIINIFLSFLATYGIVGINNINNTSQNIANNFIYLIILILFYLFYKKRKKLKKNENMFLIIFSLILSTILIIGTQLEFYSEILWSFSTILKIITLIFSIFPLCSFTLSSIYSFKIRPLKFKNNKKLALITFSIILFFNFLVFLALYPGEYGYDAGFQIMQILEKDISITSHFSLLFSVILAYIVNIGKILFNSYQIGFAIYCFLQMAFLCYVATKITIYCNKKTNNFYIYLLCILFFGLHPLYTVMSVSACQDALFAGIFALIILNTLDIVENKSYWNQKYKPIILSLLILLLCLIRNNGFYCIVIPVIFILLFCKKKKLLTLIIFIVPLILYKIYTGPIFNTLNILKTDTAREMLSIPSQQLARVYNYNNDAFSKSNIKSLNKYYTRLDNFKYYTYRQSISDPTKSVINNDAVTNNLKDYIILWGEIGLKDPENYVEAFLLNTLGFWYPNKNYNDERMYHPYIEIQMMDGPKFNDKYLNIKRESKLPIYEKLLNILLTEHTWKKIPVISTTFTSGTCFVLFLFLLGISILRKANNYLLPLSIILGLYATLFLSPVALFRYCFPIFIITPIILVLIITQKVGYH